MQLLRRLSFTMLLMSMMTLVACGGGDISGTGDGSGGETDNVIVNVTKSDGVLSTANDVIIFATVLNNGTPVSDKTVTFSLAVDGSAILDPYSGTATTDENGNASITVKVNNIKGSVNVIASYDGYSDNISFDSAGDGSDADDGDTGASGNTISITNFTNSTSINNANPAIITVHFENSDGTGLANEVITFTTTLGVLDPITGTSLTTSTGDATITLAAGTEKGAGVLTATTSSGEVSKQGFYTEGDGSVDGGGNALTITSFTNSELIDNANPAVITVHLEQADGTDLSNEVVTFTSTLGTLFPGTGTALTNETGDATITLSTGTEQGAGVLTVVSDLGDAAKQGFFTQGDGTTESTGNILTIANFTNSTLVNNTNPAVITAHFAKADGTVLVGEVITFTSTLGLLDPITGTALTDASGNALITLSAGTSEGAGVVTATASSGEVVTYGFFTAGDGSDVGGGNALTIPSFTNSTLVNNANPAVITAHFAKADGTVLAGEVITFTSTLGLLDPITGTALTDASGNALITLSAGTVEGAGVLTATSGAGDTASKSFYTAGDSVGTGVNISLVLEDANGDATEQISSIAPGKLIATVTGVTKAVIVTFNTDIGSIPIQTAIATTGSGYVAEVELLAGNSLGAGTVTAELVTGESTDLVFSIGASELGIGSALVGGVPNGEIDVPGTAISAGATAGLSVSIWDVSTNPATLFTTETVEVTFSSGCSGLSVPTANIDSPVATISGVAQSTYLAQGCEGDDIVTATANAGGTVLSATGTVSVLPADSGSIEFVSATPENISLKGVGGTEASTVIFRVRDTNGNIQANKLVNFSLNTVVGGIELSPTSATTDNEGLVQTVINSGTVHTSVRIRAELDDDASIFTQSNLLVISTGIPDQDSFSLSADILNPEAWNIDGNEVQVTARLADAFNNPVPDGTAVSFTTEGGSIEDSCITESGVCTVTWISQNVRPEGQELGGLNDGPTQIESTLNIEKGYDFTGGKEIAFEIITDKGKDTVTLDTNYESKEELLSALDLMLTISGVKAVSGFEDTLKFISTDNLDIEIKDTTPGTVTTYDVLGISNGYTYYNNPTEVVGVIDISDGVDFSLGKDISFTITTSSGTDTVSLNSDLSTSASDVIAAVNAEIANSILSPGSGVTASVYQNRSQSYIKLTSSASENILIADQGASASTLSQLGLADGTTFAERVNSSSPSRDNFMGQKYGGRVTISATAIGEESFPDLNGNGVYDEDEENAFLGKDGYSGLDVNGLPYNLAESFVDYNEDGVFGVRVGAEAGGEQEPFDDFNGDGTYDVDVDEVDKLYNGSLCGDATNCDSNNKSINVRGSLVLVMSGSHPQFVTTYPSNGGDINIVSDGTGSASVTISDIHNQPMPQGTRVIFEASVGSITGVSTYTWPNSNYNGGSSFSVTVEGVEDKTISGPLLVTVETPSGVTTTYTVATINITP